MSRGCGNLDDLSVCHFTGSSDQLYFISECHTGVVIDMGVSQCVAYTLIHICAESEPCHRITGHQGMRGGVLSALLSHVRHYLDVWKEGMQGEALFPINGLCTRVPFPELSRNLVQSPWRQEQAFGGRR